MTAPPQSTLQRLLGARASRALDEHAHGHDTQVVDPTPAPASLSTEHRFARDELDRTARRRTLLSLADDLGARLRASRQIATGVTCTIRYADGSVTRRSRTLPEAPQHTLLLARTAYAVYDSLALQRARVRSIALRAGALRPAARATRQLALDAGDDKPLALLKPEQHDLLAKLTAACPEMTQLASGIRDFAPLLTPHTDNTDTLTHCIAQVRTADLPHLHAFFRGLDRDIDAVIAGLTLSYSNGPTEGATPRPNRSRARCTDEQASPCSGTASSSDNSTLRHHRM